MFFLSFLFFEEDLQLDEGILISLTPFTFIYSIIYISLYFSDFVKFKKLEFNFDEQIQKIFDLYTKRNNQPIYKSAIILMFVTLTPHLAIFGKAIFEIYKQIKKYCGFCGIL